MRAVALTVDEAIPGRYRCAASGLDSASDNHEFLRAKDATRGEQRSGEACAVDSLECRGWGS